MTVELKMLTLSVVLGIVQIVAASHAASLQRGYQWTASSRDEKVPPLQGVAGRLDRALRNFLETFPLFRRCCPRGARDRYTQRAHRLGGAALLLGPPSVRAALCRRGPSGPFTRLERCDGRHLAARRRPVPNVGPTAGG